MNACQPAVNHSRRISARSGWTGTIFSTFVFVLFSAQWRLSKADATSRRHSGVVVVSRSRQRRAATLPGRMPVRKSIAYITR
jgi:hypothetical protein